jgi:hypothetical protein
MALQVATTVGTQQVTGLVGLRVERSRTESSKRILQVLLMREGVGAHLEVAEVEQFSAPNDELSVPLIAGKPCFDDPILAPSD